MSFQESDHLDGDVDMIAVFKTLLLENGKRSTADEIVFRPDPGHWMLNDLAETRRRNPRHRTCGLMARQSD